VLPHPLQPASNAACRRLVCAADRGQDPMSLSPPPSLSPALGIAAAATNPHETNPPLPPLVLPHSLPHHPLHELQLPGYNYPTHYSTPCPTKNQEAHQLPPFHICPTPPPTTTPLPTHSLAHCIPKPKQGRHPYPLPSPPPSPPRTPPTTSPNEPSQQLPQSLLFAPYSLPRRPLHVAVND
jgi:hypothetical protein